MKEIPQDMKPVRAHYSASFFTAVRDSITPTPKIRPDHHPRTVWDINKKAENMEEAREFIRERSMHHVHGQPGDGFGFIYSVLKHFGAVYIDIDKFVEEMEEIWRQVDENPALGHKMITMIRGLLKSGVEELEPFDEYAELGPHCWSDKAQPKEYESR